MDDAPPQSCDDRALALRACAGDSAALSELLARYQDRVYNACWRVCGHREDAEDVTQSALLRAIEALPRFEARASFYTWLFRIAMNLALSHRRRRRRSREAPSPLDATKPAREPAAQAADPAERAARSEAAARMEAALASLDEAHRCAVVLKDVEGMDYAQIADVLDLPVGTVKSRIHRGRMALRAALAHGEPTEHDRV